MPAGGTSHVRGERIFPRCTKTCAPLTLQPCGWCGCLHGNYDGVDVGNDESRWRGRFPTL
eukprot:4001870-Pyramimonas_sp.AAC.4